MTIHTTWYWSVPLLVESHNFLSRFGSLLVWVCHSGLSPWCDPLTLVLFVTTYRIGNDVYYWVWLRPDRFMWRIQQQQHCRYGGCSYHVMLTTLPTIDHFLPDIYMRKTRRWSPEESSLKTVLEQFRATLVPYLALWNVSTFTVNLRALPISDMLVSIIISILRSWWITCQFQRY